MIKKIDDKKLKAVKEDVPKNSSSTANNNDTAADKKDAISETWSTDSREELEDWIEEQGYQLRF